MKNIIFQCIFCFILFLCLTNSVFAESFFVRPAGMTYGASTGSSYEDAWAGFDKIKWTDLRNESGKVGPGDTLFICGVHHETLKVNISGNEAAHIIIRGDYPEENGVIDGNGQLRHAIYSKTNKFVDFIALKLKNTVETAFYLYNTYHESDLRGINIKNCVINNAKKNGIALTGDNITIENCEIYDIGLDGIYARGAYLKVIGCNIHDVSQIDLGDCIQLSTRGGNCYIAKNTLRNVVKNAKQCIVIAGRDSGGIVEFNDCEVSTPSNRSHFAIQVRQRNVVVRYNRFRGGNYCGVFFNGKIYSNIFENATKVGIVIAMEGEKGQVELSNNDILNCPVGIFHDSPTTLLVTDNIIFNSVDYAIKVNKNGVATFSSSGNCLYNNGTNILGTVQHNNIIGQDPKFIDYENGNYALSQTSPCVDKGIRIDEMNNLFEKESQATLAAPQNLKILEIH